MTASYRLSQNKSFYLCVFKCHSGVQHYNDVTIACGYNYVADGRTGFTGWIIQHTGMLFRTSNIEVCENNN